MMISDVHFNDRYAYETVRIIFILYYQHIAAPVLYDTISKSSYCKIENKNSYKNIKNHRKLRVIR